MHHQNKVLFSLLAGIFFVGSAFADMQWGRESDSGRRFREEHGGWRGPQVQVSMWGNGCPAQTPEALFSRDGDELALMVRGYGVELRGGYPGSSFFRDCQFTLNIRHRPYMQFRVEEIRYRGFAVAQSAQVFQNMSIQVNGRNYQGNQIFSVVPMFMGPFSLNSNISYGWSGGGGNQNPLPPPPHRRDPREDDRVQPPPPFPGPRLMSFDGNSWERDHWGRDQDRWREEERRRQEEERRRNAGWSNCGERFSSVVLNSRIGIQNLQGPGLNRIAIESPRPEEAPGFRVTWRECASSGW